MRNAMRPMRMGEVAVAVSLARPLAPVAGGRRVGSWRDALLRRMLGLADVSAAGLVALSLAWLPGAELSSAFLAGVFVPVWVLVAKLAGLYERDQRSLRHLTVGELPALFVWALVGTVALGVFLWLAPPGPPGLGVALWSFALAVVAAAGLRALARMLWRRIVPRERAVIIGSGPLGAEARRKLELFPDIHVDVAGQAEERLGANGDAAAALAPL